MSAPARTIQPKSDLLEGHRFVGGPSRPQRIAPRARSLDRARSVGRDCFPREIRQNHPANHVPGAYTLLHLSA